MGQSMSMTHLAKFVDISRKAIRREIQEEIAEWDHFVSSKEIEIMVEKRLRREIKAGIQTIQYQILTLMTTNGLLEGIGRYKIA